MPSEYIGFPKQHEREFPGIEAVDNRTAMALEEIPWPSNRRNKCARKT